MMNKNIVLFMVLFIQACIYFQGRCIHYNMTRSPSCTYAHYIIMYTENEPPSDSVSFNPPFLHLRQRPFTALLNCSLMKWFCTLKKNTNIMFLSVLTGKHGGWWLHYIHIAGMDHYEIDHYEAPNCGLYTTVVKKKPCTHTQSRQG